MSYCPNCGNAMENGSKFCSKCGTAVAAPAAPVYTNTDPIPAAPVVNTLPAEPAPVATAPVVAAEPVVSVGTKVLGFVGMGLSILGLAIASICVLIVLGLMEETGAGFAVSLVYSMLTVPPAIIGRILCSKSMAAGNTSGVCSVGSKLGLAAIIVSGVMLFFGFINLISFDY